MNDNIQSIESKLNTIIDLLQTLINQNETRSRSNIPGYPTPDTSKYLDKKIWWDNEERLSRKGPNDWPPGPSITCKRKEDVL